MNNKTYIKPFAEVTSINLVNSVMEDLPVQDPSHRAGEGFAKEGFFEEIEDENFIRPSKSLWD
jgi:hypothetical protein